MEEFTILLNIIYKKNKYKVLTNKKHQKYFLKVLEDGNLMYPTLDEFRELYDIFGYNKIKNIHFETESKKDKIINSKAEKGKVKIKPMVIFKNTLISLAVALSMIGVTKILAPTIQITGSPASESLAQSEEVEVNDIKGFFEYLNVKTDQIDDSTYVIKSMDDSKEVFCHSINEFSQYIGANNPTFDEVKQVLEDNQNIKEEYKAIIRSGIDKLQRQMPDLNLSVLYYNISRMKINEKTIEQIKEEASENAIAYFDTDDGSVSICKENYTEEEIIHEVIGHGATTGTIKKDDGTVIKLVTDMIIGDANVDLEDCLSLVGESLAEGEADLITREVLKNEAEGIGEFVFPYTPISKQLELYMKIAGINITDLANDGVVNLMKKMKENDIDTPLKYVEKDDVLCDAMTEGIEIIQPDMSVKQNVKELFWDYADDKIKNGEKVNEVMKKIKRMLAEVKVDEVIVWNNDGTISESLMSTNIEEEVATYIEENGGR